MRIEYRYFHIRYCSGRSWTRQTLRPSYLPWGNPVHLGGILKKKNKIAFPSHICILVSKREPALPSINNKQLFRRASALWRKSEKLLRFPDHSSGTGDQHLELLEHTAVNLEPHLHMHLQNKTHDFQIHLQKWLSQASSMHFC